MLNLKEFLRLFVGIGQLLQQNVYLLVAFRTTLYAIH
jgi:hypothetical protein